MGLELYCQGCDTTGGHDVDGGEAVCLSCGTVREVDPDALVGVVDMEPCGWCRETLPVNHVCRPDPTPCQSRTQLGPCGICDICKAATLADPRYGSPSDIYEGA